MALAPHRLSLPGPLLFHDFDWLAVRDRLAIDALFNGLPGEGIGIDAHVDDGRRQLLATGCHALEIDRPFLAVAGPQAIAEPTIGLEYPRANSTVRIVLAEYLRPGFG